MNKERKIFCIGLPRTGTTSIHLAFQYLGIKSLHFPKELWQDLHHPITTKYQAFSDTPLSLLYPKIDKEFPGSLFILSTRERAAWLRSCEWMFRHKSKAWAFHQAPAKTFNQALFGTNDFDEKLFTDTYDRFHRDVKDYFKDRKDILTFNLEEELNPWEKLCDFLQTGKPGVEFPHHKDYRNRVVNRITNYLERRKYNNTKQ